MCEGMKGSFAEWLLCATSGLDVAARRVVGRWGLFLADLSREELTKSCLPCHALWDCPYPVPSHQEFETSPCLVQGV